MGKDGFVKSWFLFVFFGFGFLLFGYFCFGLLFLVFGALAALFWASGAPICFFVTPTALLAPVTNQVLQGSHKTDPGMEFGRPDRTYTQTWLDQDLFGVVGTLAALL